MDASVVYPVSRLLVLVTVVVGFVWLKERKQIINRIIGAILMILGASALVIL